MTDRPNRRSEGDVERPGHPALAGAVLMIGVVILLILLAVASL